MAKYLRKATDRMTGEIVYKCEHRVACPICNDLKTEKCLDSDFIYSCDCPNEIIYKLYDTVNGKDLLVQSPERMDIGEMINALRFENALDDCDLEIHEIETATGEVKVSRDWYSYSI